MRNTPLGYDKPTRRAERASSHWCKAVESTVYCEAFDCPRCGPDEADNRSPDDA